MDLLIASTPQDNSEMNFLSLPLKVQNRLLACHLKTHVQLVDDLSEDVKILHGRLKKRNIEINDIQEKLGLRNKLVAAHYEFLKLHGLQTAFDKFYQTYQEKGRV